MKLEGKVALVTGAGRNIGRAIALAMADEGASVAINGLQNQESVDEVARLIEDRGGTAIAILADVSDPEQVDRMVAKVASTLGPVDILVNNAAIRPHGPDPRPRCCQFLSTRLNPKHEKLHGKSHRHADRSPGADSGGQDRLHGPQLCCAH